MAELVEEGTYIFEDDFGNPLYAYDFKLGLNPRRIRYEDNAPKYLDERINDNWITKLEYIDNEWISIDEVYLNTMQNTMDAINQIINNKDSI